MGQLLTLSGLGSAELPRDIHLASARIKNVARILQLKPFNARYQLFLWLYL